MSLCSIFEENKKILLLDLICFCSVLRMRVDSSVRWMDPEKFVDLFLAGRSKKTFPTYDMAFRKIWVHGAEIGKLPFWW